MNQTQDKPEIQDPFKQYENDPFHQIIPVNVLHSDDSQELEKFAIAVRSMQDVEKLTSWADKDPNYQQFKGIAEGNFLNFFRSFFGHDNSRYYFLNNQDRMQIPENMQVSLILYKYGKDIFRNRVSINFPEVNGSVEDYHLEFNPHLNFALVQDEDRGLRGFVGEARIHYLTSSWSHGKLVSRILSEVWGNPEKGKPLIHPISTTGCYDPSIAVSPIPAITRVSAAIPKICSQLKWDDVKRLENLEKDSESEKNSEVSKNILKREYYQQLKSQIEDILMFCEL